MSYVYKHIRLDNEKIFYIGVGSDSGFYRANSNRCRNKHWFNVVNKVGYRVEIIFDDISFSLALEREKELISKYGLISEGGILVNYTKGGQGQLGLTPPTAKIIFAQDILTKEVLEFKSILDASKELKIARANILKVLNDKQRYAKGFVFSFNESTLNTNIREINNNNKGWIGETPIFITSIDEFNPKFFKSLSECIRETNFNFNTSKLSKIKNGLSKTHKKHIGAQSLDELEIKFNNYTQKRKIL